MEAVDFEVVAVEPGSQNKKYAIEAGKGLGILLSVALASYLSAQKAISRDIQSVKDRAAIERADYNDRLKDLADDVDKTENLMIGVDEKLKALDVKVSEGFADIKEELIYLRRK